MDPLTASLAVGAVSGIGSYIANQSANDRAKALQDKSFQQWIALNVPDPAEQKVVLDKFVSQGTLDPKLQSAIAQNPSEFENIVTNATHKTAQNRALSELENVGYEGGLRLQDKAALQEAQMQGQQQDRAARDNIGAEMARRGTSDSGFNVAARLQGQQASGDRNAVNSMKVAAGAQDRALQAIMGAGTLGTQYRTQEFGEQAQKAGAADRIAQFNTANLRDVNAANIGAQNQAQATNLSNAQQLANQNTSLANQQQMYNKGLAQQQFENQAKKTAGMTGQYGQQAGLAQQQGQQTANLIGSIGGAASGAIGQYGYNQAMAKNQTQAAQTPPTYAQLDDYFATQKKREQAGMGSA
jgi:hypothetical protein